METHTFDLDGRLDHDALRLHALKNSAATITVLSRLLATRDALDRGYLARLEDEVARMTELLRRSLEQPRESLEVSELLDRVRRDVEPRAEDGKVQLVFSHSPAPVRGSAQDLREALLNLVNNAIEATPPGGHVRVIHTADETGGHSFVVSDEGPGMSAEVRRDAGRHRVRSSKPNGSGVGLVLARRVVESQGGQLDVMSSTRGTTVRVLLPAA
jgi:two-component system sensor histidine kinase HydH